MTLLQIRGITGVTKFLRNEARFKTLAALILFYSSLLLIPKLRHQLTIGRTDTSTLLCLVIYACI
jgi:hypothetical protein